MRSKRKSGLRYIILSLLGLLIPAAIACVFLFKIETIEISGTVVCDQWSVREASRLNEGGSIFFSKSEARKNILAKNIYADTVEISTYLPNIVRIHITETEPVAYFRYQNSDLLIDIKGKNLDMATASQTSAQSPYVRVLGLELEEPVTAGAIIKSKRAGEVDALLDLLRALTDDAYIADVSEIDIEKFRFSYTDRFIVTLGDCNDLPDKLRYIPAVIEKLASTDRGIIDLSRAAENGNVHFQPYLQ